MARERLGRWLRSFLFHRDQFMVVELIGGLYVKIRERIGVDGKQSIYFCASGSGKGWISDGVVGRYCGPFQVGEELLVTCAGYLRPGPHSSTPDEGREK